MQPEDPQKPATPEPEGLKQIRTFEGDVADAIKDQNESILSIHRAEEVRRGDSTTVVAEEGGGKRALFMAILTIVFVSLGGLGAYYAYSTYVEKTAPPISTTPLNQFISALNISAVDASTLSRQSIIGTVSIERDRPRGETSITQIQLRRGIRPTDELLTSPDFLTRLNAHAPEPLVRALDPLFMLGVIGSEPPHTFIIVKLGSFANAFPGMLEWEPRIAEDILPLFVSEEVAANVPTDALWTDVTISNRDARILRSSTGETVLLYAFYDNSMLIIADNANTLRTITGKLDSQKLSR